MCSKVRELPQTSDVVEETGTEGCPYVEGVSSVEGGTDCSRAYDLPPKADPANSSIQDRALLGWIGPDYGQGPSPNVHIDGIGVKCCGEHGNCMTSCVEREAKADIEIDRRLAQTRGAWPGHIEGD